MLDRALLGDCSEYTYKPKIIVSIFYFLFFIFIERLFKLTQFHSKTE
jgi:hypothetical protein